MAVLEKENEDSLLYSGNKTPAGETSFERLEEGGTSRPGRTPSIEEHGVKKGTHKATTIAVGAIVFCLALNAAIVAWQNGTETPHWDYGPGHGGPPTWSSLTTEWSACQNGNAQSPINVVTADVSTGGTGVVFDYSTVKTKTIFNNGHTVEISTEGGTVTTGGVTYDLKQIHFHSASEHTFDGMNYGIEMHMVHATSDSKYAVVAFFFKITDDAADNSFLAEFFPDFPATQITNQYSKTISLSDMFSDKSYYSYTGSLTTPPCTEGVAWILMKSVHSASRSQRSTILKSVGYNFRPSQLQNSRAVTEGTGS